MPPRTSDKLVIMAKKVVEVRECDRCGKGPANIWTITGPEGVVREIDLCDQHGGPVANAYALGRAVSKPAARAGRGRHLARRPAESPPPPRLEPEPIWR
jgi:hypothetical protein